jgi:hypothetical protein
MITVTVDCGRTPARSPIFGDTAKHKSGVSRKINLVSRESKLIVQIPVIRLCRQSNWMLSRWFVRRFISNITRIYPVAGI